MKGAAAAGQTVTAINAVKSAVTTLGDSSASFGQKFTASLMAISMGVPAVVGALNNFKAMISGVKTGLTALAGAQKAMQAVQAVSVALSAKEGQMATATGIAKMKEALVSTKLVGAKTAEAIARKLTTAA
jgi:hypothetical protein